MTTKYKAKESFGYSCFECVFLLTINSPFTPLHWGADDVCIINLRKCLYPEKNKTGKKRVKTQHQVRWDDKEKSLFESGRWKQSKKISWDPVRKCIRVKKEDAKVYLLHGQFPQSWSRSLLWSTCKYGSRNCAKKLWLLTNKLLTTKERRKLYFWWSSAKSLLCPPAETCHAGTCLF